MFSRCLFLTFALQTINPFYSTLLHGSYSLICQAQHPFSQHFYTSSFVSFVEQNTPLLDEFVFTQIRIETRSSPFHSGSSPPLLGERLYPFVLINYFAQQIGLLISSFFITNKLSSTTTLCSTNLYIAKFVISLLSKSSFTLFCLANCLCIPLLDICSSFLLGELQSTFSQASTSHASNIFVMHWTIELCQAKMSSIALFFPLLGTTILS